PELRECSPEERVLMLETLLQLDAMLDGLGPRVRQAFLLAQLDGLGYAEIARRLGVSVSSVTKYMARATEQCLLFALDAEGWTPPSSAWPGVRPPSGTPASARRHSARRPVSSGRSGTSNMHCTNGPGSVSNACGLTCRACP